MSGLFVPGFVASTLLLALLSLSTVVLAQGEHSRRVAAELRVITGDLQRLQQPATSELHRTGLTQRILGGLAALDILMRLADQEKAKPVLLQGEQVREARQLFINGEFQRFDKMLRAWLSQYPLDSLAIVTRTESSMAKELHTDLCAACHDNPNRDTERPAYNLFEEAATLNADEFLSRMLIGVRGDRVTGIDNPLTDYQLAALIAFYN